MPTSSLVAAQQIILNAHLNYTVKSAAPDPSLPPNTLTGVSRGPGTTVDAGYTATLYVTGLNGSPAASPKPSSTAKPSPTLKSSPTPGPTLSPTPSPTLNPTDTYSNGTITRIGSVQRADFWMLASNIDFHRKIFYLSGWCLTG